MDNKGKLKEITEKFNALQREKAQLEQRISDIVREIYRLQGEDRLLKQLEAEEKTKKKEEDKK